MQLFKQQRDQFFGHQINFLYKTKKHSKYETDDQKTVFKIFKSYYSHHNSTFHNVAHKKTTVADNDLKS